MMTINKSKYNGYVTLTAVIVLSLIALTTVSGLLLINSNSIKTQDIRSDYYNTYYGAESCAEYALNQIQTDLNYAPGDTITIDDVTCEVVEVLGNGNQDRIIRVESTGEAVSVRLQIDLNQVNPIIEIDNWQEVSSFN